jgi:hypothetical protein
VFGSTTNSKGFREITGAGVIQGDGINLATMKASQWGGGGVGLFLWR